MMIPNKQYISGPPVCSNSCWVAIGSNHPSTMASSRSSRASWTPPRCRRCHHRGCWSCSKNSCSQNIIKLHKTCHILSWPSIYYWITCWDIKWYIYICVSYTICHADMANDQRIFRGCRNWNRRQRPRKRSWSRRRRGVRTQWSFWAGKRGNPPAKFILYTYDFGVDRKKCG